MTCIDEELKFNLTMNGCVDSCGEYDGRGECMTYYTEGNVIMSTCNCKAGNYTLSVMLIIQPVVNTFFTSLYTFVQRTQRTSTVHYIAFDGISNVETIGWTSKLKQFKIPCRKKALVQIRINVWTVYSINLFNILISNVPSDLSHLLRLLVIHLWWIMYS